MDENTVRYNLLQYYGPESGAQIEDVSRVPGGWEADLYRYVVRYPDDRPDLTLALRLYHGDGADRKARVEFEWMGHLAEMGYPVPHVYHQVPAANSIFANPFIIMDWVEGKRFGDEFANDDPAVVKSALVRLSQLLVDLHFIPWNGDVEIPFADDPYGFIDTRLDEYRYAVNDQPDFLRWLDELAIESQRVPCDRYALLHGDYHAWNVIQTPQDELVVLDWSGVEWGDPRHDVAWTWCLMATQRSREIADQFVELYEQQSGTALEHFDFFQNMMLGRRVGSIVLSVTAGTESMGMHPDAVASMRQGAASLRRAYDLLVGFSGIRLALVEQLLADWGA
jgi:aminoglycoside phosphotransferase (APT) family kinase protein